MRKMILAASLCALAVSTPLVPLRAEPAAEAPSAGPANARTVVHPALWVVQDEDTTIYLFGTIHILPPELDWLNGPVKAAFTSADQLVLEVAPPDPQEGQAITMRFAASDGRKLSDRLPAAQREHFAAAMAALGIQPAGVDPFDPWFIGMTLASIEALKAGYDPASGPETVLADAAGRAGKPVLGLETMDSQFGILDGLSEPTQIALLMKTVDELPEATNVLGRMVERWGAGDPAGVAAIVNDGFSDSPELAEKLLEERNRNWVAWLEARMKQPGTVFVAVGAGHLAGADSVIDLLQADGLAPARVQP